MQKQRQSLRHVFHVLGVFDVLDMLDMNDGLAVLWIWYVACCYLSKPQCSRDSSWTAYNPDTVKRATDGLPIHFL